MYDINILLVEDSKINRLIFKRLLVNNGYENVYEAVNGIEAINMFNKKDIVYDIIFMDIHMPIMNGIDAMRIIRSDDRNIPIIILTADITDYIKNNKENLGFTDYVNKPIDICQLLKLIKKYCIDKDIITIGPEHDFSDIELEFDNNVLQGIIGTMEENEKLDFFNEFNNEFNNIVTKYDNVEEIVIELKTIKIDFHILKDMSYQVGFNYIGDISKTIEQYLKLIKESEIDLTFILDNIMKILEVYKKIIIFINKKYNMNLKYDKPYTL
jgi:CheY-like chemotaxis protein